MNDMEMMKSLKQVFMEKTVQRIVLRLLRNEMLIIPPHEKSFLVTLEELNTLWRKQLHRRYPVLTFHIFITTLITIVTNFQKQIRYKYATSYFSDAEWEQIESKDIPHMWESVVERSIEYVLVTFNNWL